MKTFTVTGVSTLNGVVKVRFTNDMAARIKILAKNDHSEIRLIELDEPMTKIECALRRKQVSLSPAKLP